MLCRSSGREVALGTTHPSLHSLWGRALWSMSQMAVRGWCSVAMMVCPSAARHDMWSMMFSAANESRPARMHLSAMKLRHGLGTLHCERQHQQTINEHPGAERQLVRAAYMRIIYEQPNTLKFLGGDK